MRLYTDFDLFQQPFEGQETTVVMLLPFEPNRPENGNAHPFDSCYDEWIQTAAKAFELTSIEQADAGVFPVQWITREHPRHSEFKRALDDFTLRCERAGIPVLLFFQHDFDEEIDVRNTLVFRTSLYRSRRKAYEHAVPYWSEDILRIYANGRLVEREKGEKPVVGFCGYLDRLRPRPMTRAWLKDQAKGFLQDKGLWPQSGHRVRRRVISRLASAKTVIPNFIIRDGMWPGFDERADPGDVARSHAEYVQNMLESDYIPCTRGAGNYSLRFYETMCVGRIPVFVDTDCVLPFDNFLDWKSHCIWVEHQEINRIEKRIAAHFAAMSGQEYVRKQLENRDFWERKVSPSGFFSELKRHFAWLRQGI